MGSSALQIIKSRSDSLRSTPSSVTNGVPVGKVLTITLLPRILAASKACKGWPNSWQIKLVMSTTLLMGRTPTACSFSFNQSGDSVTVNPEIVTPVYRGAASEFSTETSIGDW